VQGGYVPSAAWRLSYEDGLLVLSAGADRAYGVEDVDERAALELLEAWERGSVEPAQLSSAARTAVEELIQAGALSGGAAEAAPRAVEVRFVGERDGELERHLSNGIAASGVLRLADGDADLLLYVRTSGRLVDIYESAEPVLVPHLLLDLAYDHTISLGPLVFAGETACLACLAGRIGRLWGDREPPQRPAMLESPALAAALATRELEKVAAGDVRLANATAAYDFETHQVTVGAVYKLPWCPVCGDGAETNGCIDLPWSRPAA
jgi:bacteriocin biosynthesis cyclodehydratase domain-containing protein